MKLSTYLKGVSGLATIASAIPAAAPVALPVAAITGGMGTVAGLMGKGFEKKEINKIKKRRGRQKRK